MKLRWAEQIAAALGPPLMKSLAATWRFHETGSEDWRSLVAAKQSFIYVLWHSRILPLLALHKREGVVLLISRHRDGTYIADVSEGWGYRSVRGSTKRGGEVGLLGIVRALQEPGTIVAVTPDGPRGPKEHVQPGAVAAAQHAGVPIIAVGTRTPSAWYARSWDRMCIPKPFAAIDVRYSAAIEIGPGKDGLRRGIQRVARALHEVTGTAAPGESGA
ncbi:MAG TPA: lysophospholipid acyltransferase family protein [Gemmatimonadales bacterium]|nr:lysophospholipid acyltransferase family protein [Gemmatimonadales bacterium]